MTDRADFAHCLVGVNVARQFSLAPGSQLNLRYAVRISRESVSLAYGRRVSIDSGGQEDSQIYRESSGRTPIS